MIGQRVGGNYSILEEIEPGLCVWILLGVPLSTEIRMLLRVQGGHLSREDFNNCSKGEE